MSRIKTLQDMFKRYRRPGDLVFALAFLLFAIFLLSQLGEEVKWTKRTKFFAQPSFWPAVAILGMVFFGALHCVGSLVSPRIRGRWREVLFWARSLEYLAWFMAYVIAVPLVGYLPSTVAFAVVLTARAGYRGARMLGAAGAAGIAIVVIFKSFLQVKVPGGAVYEYLPDGIRSFMLTYF